MDRFFLEEIRRRELDAVRDLLPPPPCDLLEIGAGSGFQAGLLAALGYRVKAIDVLGSVHEDRRVFPVEIYDGRHIPAGDAAYDVVFSSMVLNEVPHLHDLLLETRRALRPDGIGLHGTSSPSWRLLTLLTHYPHAALALARRLSRGPGSETRRPPFAERVARLAFPERLGERGNALAELCTLSELSLRRDLTRAGFEVLEVRRPPLVYAGHMLLGARLPIPTRTTLAAFIGGASIFYRVKPVVRR